MPHSKEPETKFDFPSDLDLVTIHIVPAVPELVFRAYTDPGIIPHWWGRKSLKTVVEKMDVTPGGDWHFLQFDEDGNGMGFHGEFCTIEPSRLLSYTIEWDAFPAIKGLETIIFKQVDHSTRLKGITHFRTFEDREKICRYGWEQGIKESMERLASFVAQMKMTG